MADTMPHRINPKISASSMGSCFRRSRRRWGNNPRRGSQLQYDLRSCAASILAGSNGPCSKCNGHDQRDGSNCFEHCSLGVVQTGCTADGGQKEIDQKDNRDCKTHAKTDDLRNEIHFLTFSFFPVTGFFFPR